MRAAAWIAGVLLLAMTPRVPSQQPLLQIVGEPYFGGAITVHLRAPEFAGQPAALAYGLDPLTVPINTGKGAWYIGQLFKILSLGVVPADGRIDLPLTIPPETPAVEGLPVIVQAFVPPRLSNPAELRLDAPYLLALEAVEILPPFPLPGASFGDRVAIGDFDGDSVKDLAVGAAFESVAGFGVAGKVYVLWGPDWTEVTTLEPDDPGPFTAFGFGLAAADFDDDDMDDLVVTQVAPDPPAPGDYGRVFVVRGVVSRDLDPELVALSPTDGIDAANFGRFATAGDVTGDGIPDAVIGAHGTSDGNASFSGALMILPGPDLDSPITIPNPTPVGSDFFGTFVTLAHLNSDEHLDILEASSRAAVIDPHSGTTLINAGEIHIGYGPSFTQWDALTHPIKPAAFERFGERAGASDLDDDGVFEIATTSEADEAFILRADGSLVSTFPKPPALFETPFEGSSFGYGLAFLDANGDGRTDLLIGDPFDGQVSPCNNTGGGVVWTALAPHFSTFTTVFPPTEDCGDIFGWTVLVADVDGSGIPSLITSARFADSFGIPNSGKLVIHQTGR